MEKEKDESQAMNVGSGHLQRGVMASWELKSVMAERIHSYFTASDYFPDNVDRAFDDGKERYIQTLKRHIAAIEQLTLEDYRKVNNSSIGVEL